MFTSFEMLMHVLMEIRLYLIWFVTVFYKKY